MQRQECKGRNVNEHGNAPMGRCFPVPMTEMRSITEMRSMTEMWHSLGLLWIAINVLLGCADNNAVTMV